MFLVLDAHGLIFHSDLWGIAPFKSLGRKLAIGHKFTLH